MYLGFLWSEICLNLLFGRTFKLTVDFAKQFMNISFNVQAIEVSVMSILYNHWRQNNETTKNFCTISVPTTLSKSWKFKLPWKCGMMKLHTEVSWWFSNSLRIASSMRQYQTIYILCVVLARTTNLTSLVLIGSEQVLQHSPKHICFSSRAQKCPDISQFMQSSCWLKH